MIIFLILGVGLGILSVLFVLQNVTPVTVSFFTWQIDGSLAVMLFLAMLSGIFITLLLLFPSFIRDAYRLSRLNKKARVLEDEVAQHKAALQSVPPQTPVSKETL